MSTRDTKTLPSIRQDDNLVMRVIAMPRDTNPAGDIFGGWTMSQMDLAGAITAREKSGHMVVTVGATDIVFYLPIYIGDILSCHTKIQRVGNTSVTVLIECWAHRRKDTANERVASGVFTYVALDENRQLVKVGK